MQYPPHNVHCNTLHSNCNTTVHLLCSIFHVMFTVTHSIQATIPLFPCCAVSSNELTLNLRPNHIQHSTLTLSTINLTATHNSYRRNTQQAVPNTTHKDSVPVQSACALHLVLVVSYLLILNSLAVRSRTISIITSYRHPKTALYSVFGASLRAGGKVTKLLFIQATMLHFLQVGCFSHAVATAAIFMSFCNIAKSEY